MKRFNAKDSPLYQEWVKNGRHLDPNNRFWEPWTNNKLHAEECLKGWGHPSPSFKPKTIGQRGKVHRTKRVAAHIRGETVLDMGCGVGHLLGAIKTNWGPIIAEYLGLDCENMIDLANQCFPLDTDCFQVGDVFDISGKKGWAPPHTGSYDTVTSLQVVQHLPELYTPLQEMWDHTEKRLIVAMLPPTMPVFTIREDGLISHRYTLNEINEATERLAPHWANRLLIWPDVKELPDEPRSPREQALLILDKYERLDT